MLPSCSKCEKNNFKSSQDSNTYINCKISCMLKITEWISHPKTISKSSVAENNAQNYLRYSDTFKLKAIMDTLTSQIQTISWQLKNASSNIKEILGNIADLSNQQEVA